MLKYMFTILLISAAVVSQPVHAREVITVYKSPTCGCCKKWISHLEANGFTVKSHDLRDVRPKKIEFGISPQMASCHTATVRGYVIEGHVPANDIKRLLKTTPADIRGLSVPGMPIGSPGMEQGSRKDPYHVIALQKNGKHRVYSSH